MLHFPLTLETKKINLIRRGSCENVLRTKLYLYLGGTWRKKKNPKQNKTKHTHKKNKSPDVTPEGEWMMNLDAVRQQSELQNYEHSEE